MPPSSRPPHRARGLTTKSVALQWRFRATQNPADLDEAVTAAQEAVDATPAGHHRRAMLIALGHALQLRCTTGHPHDLDAAIDVFRQAVAAAERDYPSGVALSSLSGALTARYERSEDPDDLDAAVVAGHGAVNATSRDDLALAKSLLSLGRTLRLRAKRPGRRGDLSTAMDVLRRAAELGAGPAVIRLRAARGWGTAARDFGDPGAAADGYAAAVALLPEVAWRGLDYSVQEEFLAEWSGLANDAACAAIEAGEPERAVQLLDQGRSVLWTQALHLRSESALLAERHPQMAAELDQIRHELDAPRKPLDVGGRDDEIAAGKAQEERRRLATRWDALVRHVHTLDGFGDFLAPTPFTDLRTAAVDGPVVIVNASRLGCHALVVLAKGPVRVVELTGLTYDDALNQANLLLKVLARSGDPDSAYLERDRHAVLDILKWLWQTIVQPVLDVLGHTDPPRDAAAWPRVWWCPTGPLTVLPLHAAGRHSRTNAQPTAAAETTAGRVVSSYTSTLGTLRRARLATLSRPVRQLAIGMPDTPHRSPLPAVHKELEILASYVPPPDHALHIVGAEATRGAVVDALPNCPWLHLACHASRHAEDPSQSAIALWDGPLSVADLAGMRLEHGGFAFFSACETAAGSPRLLDEAIHLAAAMQMLGFRHVIATLWTIRDSPAPGIADAVYGRIVGTGRPDAGPAAEALHHAVETLRESGPADPLRWAPYIHSGP
jgi:CHAT domain